MATSLKGIAALALMAAVSACGLAQADSSLPKIAIETGKVTQELHGTVYLWYYQPLSLPVKNKFELYAAILDYDAKFDDFGVHFEPRFRDTPLRSYYPSNIWVQEVYAYYKQPAFTVKAGKEYTRFGIFWDNSFYGNMQYFDGLKLSPDYGFSLEGELTASSDFKAPYFLQYFVNDGTTNGSLPGRDTVSITGARKRNEFIARAVPTYSFAKESSVALGLSGQHLQADLTQVGFGMQPVNRWAVDLTVVPVKKLSVYGEFARQTGQTVTSFPLTGFFSKNNNYYLAGIEHSCGKWTARYNFSEVNYTDLSVQEISHIPGLAYALHPNVSLLAEYVFWYRNGPAAPAIQDRSFNLVLNAHF